MSDIITPNVDTEVTTKTVTNSEVKMVNNNTSSEMSKLSSQYKFWGRFNQILIGIGGVFSVPFGIPAIVAAVKLNKSIENVDEVSKDSKSQEFVESVKDFHKWVVINFIVVAVSALLVGILLGGLIFAAIAGTVSEGKKNGSFNLDDSSMDYKKPKGNKSNDNKNSLPNDSDNFSNNIANPFNINTEEGSMSMDKDGNMKIVDKDGKVTTVNIDGTLGTEK